MEDRQSRHAARILLLGGTVLGATLLSAAAAMLQLQDPGSPAAGPPVAAITVDRSGTSPPERSLSSSDGSAANTAAGTAAAASPLADRLVGDWTLEKHGVRTLRLRDDGTASVDVRLNMLGALMYGERLTLELNWTLDGDLMTQQISSGTPRQAVARLIRDWGDRREYRIVEVDDDHLVLSEVGDDEDRDVWSRVRSHSTSTAPTKQSPR